MQLNNYNYDEKSTKDADFPEEPCIFVEKVFFF